MAGSLQRPPFKIITTHKCSIPKYKSTIKLQRQRLLHTKGSQHSSGKNRNSHKNPQQLHQLLKPLKYCKSLLSLGKLLLLLPSSLPSFSNDSCWAIPSESKNNRNNLTPTAKKYAQLRQQQQQSHQYQQLQLQQIHILNKVFKTSKFRRNLLDRKKLQQIQLKDIQSYRNNQLYEKLF